jgi:rhamnulokinase
MGAAACYLGVDVGAESGRVMAGRWDGKVMRLEEMHRFANGGVQLAGTLRWDVLRIWSDVRHGLAVAAQRNRGEIVSVGVDTWAIDYVLLSRSDEIIGQPYHYRDARTRGLVEEVCGRVPRAEIFAATGLQFMELNTLYQLIATQRDHPELLAAADCLLMVPDFLHWCLCGARVVEFTNATTTQFFNPRTRTWATDLLRRLGLPAHMLAPVVEPGTHLGAFRPTLAEHTGLGGGISVIAPATHDTASAVAAVPTRASGRTSWAYISSGTWSLIGVESATPILSARACELNFTNEGGIDGTWRVLKNVMGLWLLQRCRLAFEERGGPCGYAELIRLATAASATVSFIDPDDLRFLNPGDMPRAIQDYCRETGQPVPESDGALIRCILESLALKYRFVLGSVEELTGDRVEVVHIVGGGSQNRILNQFTANACGCEVVTGPVEATVFGNLLVQARSRGEVASLAEMRAIVRASSELEQFTPMDASLWDEAASRFQRICLGL